MKKLVLQKKLTIQSWNDSQRFKEVFNEADRDLNDGNDYPF